MVHFIPVVTNLASWQRGTTQPIGASKGHNRHFPERRTVSRRRCLNKDVFHGVGGWISTRIFRPKKTSDKGEAEEK